MPDELSMLVEHEIPGRLRVRLAGLKEEPSLGDRITALAGGITGLEEVSVRPQTGSVVFRYSLEETSPARFLEALRRRAHVRHQTREKVPPPKPIGAEMIHSIRRFWTDSDRRVDTLSGGSVDLRSSLPWLFMLFGVRQFIAHPEARTLPWYTAFYHSMQTIFLYEDDQKDKGEEDGQLMEDMGRLTAGE